MAFVYVLTRVKKFDAISLSLLKLYAFVGVWVGQPARTALRSGCEGVAAINTIMSVMGINLDTLRPEPCVEG